VKTEDINEIKDQLKNHLEYLTERIGELNRMGYIVNRADWLHEERVNCEAEIELWEGLTS